MVRERLLTAKKARDLLNWRHSGFNLDAGDKAVAPYDAEGRRRLAEYLLRAPFSLEKIPWEPDTGRVIYRSKRNWRTKRDFQVFSAGAFLAAAIEHIPPKSQQTVRYYGLLYRLWEGIVSLPPPPAPPFDIETLEPLDHLASPGAPGHWDWEDSQEEAPPAGWWRTGAPAGSEAVWEAPELPLGEGRLLVLAAEPPPDDGMPVYRAG